MRAIAGMAGILGGICWVVRPFLDGTAADALMASGAVLLGLGAFLLGLSLVKSQLWLQAIVSLGVVALCWAVLATLHTEGDNDVIDTTIGAAAIVLGGVLLVRSGRAREPRNHGGSHSR